MTFPRNLPAVRDALKLEIDRTRVRLGRLECDLLALDGAETPADVVYEIALRVRQMSAARVAARNYSLAAVERYEAVVAEVEILHAAGGWHK